jgi:hypothetical protein
MPLPPRPFGRRQNILGFRWSKEAPLHPDIVSAFLAFISVFVKANRPVLMTLKPAHTALPYYSHRLHLGNVINGSALKGRAGEQGLMPAQRADLNIAHLTAQLVRALSSLSPLRDGFKRFLAKVCRSSVDPHGWKMIVRAVRGGESGEAAGVVRDTNCLTCLWFILSPKSESTTWSE